MKRTAALFCMIFVLAQYFAVVLPPEALLLPAVFCVVFFLFRKRHAAFSVCLTISLAVAFSFLAHFCYLQLKVVPLRQFTDEKTHEISGYVLDVQNAYEEGMVSCVLYADHIDGRAFQTKIYVTSMPDSADGETIRANFLLTEGDFFGNDRSRYADAIFLNAEYLDGIEWGNQSGSPRVWFKLLQKKLSSVIVRYLDDPYGAILSAVCTGDKSYLSSDTTKLFRRAGLSHILVVSGLHLSLLCSMFIGQNDSFGRKRKIRFIFRVIFVAAIAGLTGLTNSVCRAGFMILMMSAASAILLPYDAVTALGAAGFLLSLQNSFVVYDIGFQLSFFATAGLLAANALWTRKLEQHAYRGIAAAAVSFSGLFIASAAAALATLPVQLVQGLSVSGVSVFSNLLISWTVPPILLLGLFTGIAGLSALFEIPVLLSSLLAGLLLRYDVFCAEKCAGLSLSALRLPRTYSLFVLALLLFMILGFYCLKRSRSLIFVVPAICVFAVFYAVRMDKDVLKITVVGRKNLPCAVIEKNKDAVIIFRGGRPNYNKIADFLDETDIQNIECCICFSKENNDTVDLSSWNPYYIENMETNDVACLEYLDTDFQVLKQKNGRVVVVNSDGPSVCISSGSPIFSQPHYVDVYIGSQTISSDIRANQYLCTSKNFLWEKENMPLVISSGQPVIEISDGKGYHIEKGGYLFG